MRHLIPFYKNFIPPPLLIKSGKANVKEDRFFSFEIPYDKNYSLSSIIMILVKLRFNELIYVSFTIESVIFVISGVSIKFFDKSISKDITLLSFYISSAKI